MYTPGGALTAVFGEERNGEVIIGEGEGEGEVDGVGDGDGVSSSGTFSIDIIDDTYHH